MGIPEDIIPERVRDWHIAILIALIGIIVFSFGLTNPFQGDDFGQIVNNGPVHSLKNAPQLISGGTFPNGANHALVGAYYRPLMMLSYSAVYTFFGPHPIYFHIFQAIIVIASAVILYFLFRLSFAKWIATLLALLFLVHPLNSQTAFAIPALQDALYFFFGILGLYLLIRNNSKKYLFVTPLLFFFALLSKEPALIFVIMGQVYLIIWDRRRARLYAMMGLGMLVSYFALRSHAIGLFGSSPDNAPILRATLGQRLLTAPSIMHFYVFKGIWPWHLATAYYWVNARLSINGVLLPLIVDILVLIFVIVLALKLKPRLSKSMFYSYIFYSGFLLLGMMTLLQFMPLDMTACENWARILGLGLLGIIGVYLTSLNLSRRHACYIFFATCALILIFGTSTAYRAFDYRSEVTLAQKDVIASPDDYTAHLLIGKNLGSEGKYSEALPYAERSIHIFPMPVNYNLLGLIYAQQGDYAKAESAYRTGLKYGDTSKLYEDSGQAAMYLNDDSNSINLLTRGVGLYPSDSLMWTYLALLYARNGDMQDATKAIKNARMTGQVSDQVYEAITTGKPLRINLDQNRSFVI